MNYSTKDYGSLATQLVQESRRSTATDTLQKYNDGLVRAIIREQRQLESLVDSAQNPDGTPSNDMVLYIAIINRNKRCLLAYHNHRIERLKELFWAAGGALHLILSTSANTAANGQPSADIRAKLSPHEVDFLRAYSESVLMYSKSLDVDLFPPIVNPPKDLHVTVRVARECGVIQTEVGAIDFKKGHRYQVRRSDVEHLIVQGYLEEV